MFKHFLGVFANDVLNAGASWLWHDIVFVLFCYVCYCDLSHFLFAWVQHSPRIPRKRPGAICHVSVLSKMQILSGVLVSPYNKKIRWFKITFYRNKTKRHNILRAEQFNEYIVRNDCCFAKTFKQHMWNLLVRFLTRRVTENIRMHHHQTSITNIKQHFWRWWWKRWEEHFTYISRKLLISVVPKEIRMSTM